ncbi:PilZ domain-containing protein [Geomonas subterranea]|uniref:PilZ domain-containing protein n=1 Tax=Geomonas subterranea TaxID=2847989 RepID=A0ABX8LLP7_9BACT|nr:PilZ domain-containing protein [Geomonas subterranea]QXE92975.1 PilZ domain-containing protein [Geomonas subterranea]QXM08918.1 PilZ domain-containing protein [Geomonas subterranea]
MATGALDSQRGAGPGHEAMASVMEDTRILMVVREPEARSAYEQALDRIGVSYHTACDFNEVLRMTVESAYSGLLVDVLTLVRCSKEEKNIAYDCINFYPTLRIKWDARQQSITPGPQENSAADTHTALTRFVQERCGTFPARCLRRFARKDSYLSLLLSRDGLPSTAALKTFTVNISQGGAFIQTTDPFAKTDRVWLRFPALAEEALQAGVCWSIPWGGCRSIPGIGVMFDQGLSPRQVEWLKQVAPA